LFFDGHQLLRIRASAFATTSDELHPIVVPLKDQKPYTLRSTVVALSKKSHVYARREKTVMISSTSLDLPMPEVEIDPDDEYH